VANETISQLPLSININGTKDLLEISRYTGAPGTGYTSMKIPPALIAGLSPITTATAIEFIIGASPGYTLNTGLAGYLTAPYGGTINSASMVASDTGSITVDIWLCTYLQFDAGVTHPVAGDSICGGNPPAITSGVKYTNASLLGWTTAFSAGNVFAFNVSSTSHTISQVTLTLNVTKTTLP
jgi:hypothetical protein